MPDQRKIFSFRMRLFILFLAILMACTCVPSGILSTNTATPAFTNTPLYTPTPALAISRLQDVTLATVQILAEGSFVDPTQGYINTASWAGSGFLIDSSGLIVTNNHVAAGAAFLKVRFDGEAEGESHSATLLGTSECWDLAVLQIQGSNFHYLTWYKDDITVGTDVYTAGFPLGEPQFAVTRGVVSKNKADGNTPWSSMDSIIMHDATINPGNSGGPLVDPQGRVVGINFMSIKSANQYFAINAELAQPILKKLMAGQDTESLGLNGVAYRIEFSDGTYYPGIFIQSVKSGSAADSAGLAAGDIILTMENIVMAKEGTMAEYCSIIRGKQSGGAIAFEAVRDLYTDDPTFFDGRITVP
jgi:serine protease Do